MANKTIEFRHDGPFRAFVVSFWIAHHGMFDLFTRGVRAHSEELRRAVGATEQDQAKAIANKVADGRVTERMRLHLEAMMTFDAQLHPWPLELRKRGGSSIGAQPAELAREVSEQAGGGLPTDHMDLLCGGLLISAYQATSDWWPSRTSPEYQFLYHCRNAAAHGARFKLKAREPKRPAVWRGLIVDRTWNGELLIRHDVFGVAGKLEPGDPILLLWDLEQTLPPGWRPR